MTAALLPILLFVSAAGTEFHGTLEPQLVAPAPIHQVSSFALATGLQKQLLQTNISPRDKVFAGTVRDATAFVVEHDGATVSLFVDVSGDGLITPDEKFDLGAGMDSLQAGIALVEFPLEGRVPAEYPVRVYVYRGQKDPNTRMVGESPFTFVRGTVNVNGRPVLVEYVYDLKKGGVDLRNGWQGMDVNGNGKIDTGTASPERLLAKDENLIFHVGEEYLSTKSIDTAKREVVLVSHEPHEYQTIPLVPGTAVPDFSFTDFNGQRHKLSEFAGKTLLLDFWASWCGPCVADLPHVRDAYTQLRDKGLVVIGINGDEDAGKARAMIAREKLNYPQATFDSTRDLIEKRFRIVGWPTYVIVGPERKILAANPPEARGEQMVSRLHHWLELSVQK